MNSGPEPARALDAGGVGAVLSDCIEAAEWLPSLHSRAEHVAAASQMIEAGWVQVVRRSDRIAGFVARDESELHCLYVTPCLQGQGVGTDLLDQAKSASTTLHIWTYVRNDAAQRFFRVHGFRDSKDRRYSGNDAGLPELRLEWKRTR